MTLKQQARELFNDFIGKWCKENYAHLIDNDENDGERFREKLDSLLTQAVQEEDERIAKELHNFRFSVPVGKGTFSTLYCPDCKEENFVCKKCFISLLNKE
jgi:hypothetical protein